MQIHPEFQLHNRSFENHKDLLKHVKEKFPSHASFLEELFSDSDFIMARTSGSTGKPKPVKISKNNLIKSAEKSINFFQLPPGTKALLNLSPQFIAGKLMWVRALTGGWNLFLSQADTASTRQILQKEKFDFGAMVPLQLSQNIELITKIKKLIIGGAPVGKKQMKEIKNLPIAVFATYGMTETITHVAVKGLNKKALEQIRGLKEGIYTALPGIRFEKDKRNCLVIHTGYYPEAVVTNDVVELIDDHHFEWKGRFDNIINSGGIKIQPEEIEKKLSPFISSDFFIYALPDEKLGQRLVLVIEGKKDLDIDFEKLLPKYHIPKNILFVPHFTRSFSGKIKRKETLEKAGF